MTNLLEVHNVRRSFPRGGGEELLVLDDVNLTLKQGEIVGLLGRSGSGKSTLLRLIAGLARPQGGSLTYMGAPIEGPAQGVATLTIPAVVLDESFLSFLGLGIQAPQASWGSLLADGAQVINPVRSYWWLLAFPALLMSATLLALNFLGDGLRDALDPRQRK
jgi:energy-coupling factor transporter ATP-binding protein EcfA2